MKDPPQDDPDSALRRIIARAISEARASGGDYLGQTESAVRAVLAVEPDITASDALLVVKWMREGPHS